MSTMLHVGDVTHVRHTPFRHRFRYRMWMLSCDIDAPEQSRLFRVDRPALVSLHTKDHGPRDGTPWRPWVAAKLAQAGLAAYGHRIRFMAIPRMFGFAFNPIAFFLCFDDHGQLGAVIHQVKNTFGDQTEYVLPVAANARPIRQAAVKRMYVSPFFDMRGGYRFTFSDPMDEEFRLMIRYGAEETPRMTAAMRLRAETLSNRAVLRLLATMPLMTIKVFAAIHWEALRLVLRGAQYHPLPHKDVHSTGASA